MSNDDDESQTVELHGCTSKEQADALAVAVGRAFVEANGGMVVTQGAPVDMAKRLLREWVDGVTGVTAWPDGRIVIERNGTKRATVYDSDLIERLRNMTD